MFHEPDFLRNPLEGQMRPDERKALYDLIINEKPLIVFESGTWKGGGSTYFISSALTNNEQGVLYTCEFDKSNYECAKDLYNSNDVFKELSKRIVFLNGDCLNIYPKILNNFVTQGFIDVCILDGSDEPAQTVYEFSMFRHYMSIGSFLVCHDWNSRKCSILQDLLKQDSNWSIISVVSDLGIIKRVG